MTRNALTLDDARQVLAAQPFSRLLGARIVQFGEGRASLELDVRDDLRQQFGLVHGGVLAYLVDNVLTFAGGTALGPMVLTAGYSVDLLAPGQGVKVVAEAEVVQASSRRATCRAEVYAVTEAGDRTLCAVAQGNIVATSGRQPGGESR